MEITIHSAPLRHRDPEASIAFYRDALGFEVRKDCAHDGVRWITLGPVGQPEVSVVLYPPATHPDATDEERRIISEMMGEGTHDVIVLATRDLDSVFELLKARDAEVIQEPTRQAYGVRDCAFRDPAGNVVRIRQRIEDRQR